MLNPQKNNEPSDAAVLDGSGRGLRHAVEEELFLLTSFGSLCGWGWVGTGDGTAAVAAGSLMVKKADQRKNPKTRLKYMQKRVQGKTLKRSSSGPDKASERQSSTRAAL